MNISPITQFKQVRVTIFEMLKDRGYDIIQPANLIETDNDIKDVMDIGNSDDNIIIGKSSFDTIYVYFFFEKFGIKQANDIIEILHENEYEHAMIVSTENITSFASKLFKPPITYMDETSKENITLNLEIELFTMDRLLYNITKHSYQPKKITLIKDIQEIKFVYKTFNINKKKNMNICITDPINRYYNGKSGEMYKVEYKGGRIDYVTII